jgi:anti-sigma regulatory factor (Ser/Thr protein kinase)
MLRLRLPVMLDSLERVNALVQCLAAEAALSPRQAYRLRLAAEELFTNIVRHGRGMDADGARVVVEGGITGEGVWIRLVDTAEPFDPFRSTCPTGPPVPDRDPGVLGLHLARYAVDSACHVYEGGTNRTTFTVSRAERSEEPTRERWSECV